MNKKISLEEFKEEMRAFVNSDEFAVAVQNGYNDNFRYGLSLIIRA